MAIGPDKGSVIDRFGVYFFPEEKNKLD